MLLLLFCDDKSKVIKLRIPGLTLFCINSLKANTITSSRDAERERDRIAHQLASQDPDFRNREQVRKKKIGNVDI